MAYRIGGIEMEFQGLNLNCGLYCMNALMRRLHRNICPSSEAKRHARGKHIAYNAYALSEQRHYGLAEVAQPVDQASWEALLRGNGPAIIAGDIGTVRMFGGLLGHFVLVVGVTDAGEIEYYDPLRPANMLGGRLPRLAIPNLRRLTGAGNVLVCASAAAWTDVRGAG